MPDLASIDLNLLRVLAALLETRSITRTGEQLGISQPAASRSVARLRRLLGDELLVRTSGGYVLTPHLEALRPRVTAALAAAEEVFSPVAFEAATARRAFRLAATDYGSMTVVTPMAPRFMALAPQARLDIRPWAVDTLAELESGGLDMALYADASLPPQFHYRELFVETYACVVRRGHPLDQRLNRSPGEEEEQRRLPLEVFGQYPHALMTYPDGRNVGVDDPFSRMGMVLRHVPLRLPYFLAAPWIVAESDLVMTVPRRIADRLARVADLVVLSLPASAETFSYRLVWHERGHKDPALRWLRSLILECCGATRKAGSA